MFMEVGIVPTLLPTPAACRMSCFFLQLDWGPMTLNQRVPGSSPGAPTRNLHQINSMLVGFNLANSSKSVWVTPRVTSDNRFASSGIAKRSRVNHRHIGALGCLA